MPMSFRAETVASIALLTPIAMAASANVPFATDETVTQKATALLDDPSSPLIGNPHRSARDKQSNYREFQFRGVLAHLSDAGVYRRQSRPDGTIWGHRFYQSRRDGLR